MAQRERNFSKPYLYLIESKNKSLLLSGSIIYLFAIGQDFVYSSLKNTGFFLSESMLYNSIWIISIPGFYGLDLLIRRVNLFSWKKYIIHYVIFPTLLSLIHIFLFAALFVAISNLVFEPSHRFATILKTALSNNLFFLLLVYLFFSWLINTSQKQLNINSNKIKSSDDFIFLKNGLIRYKANYDEIILIESESPYTRFYLENTKFLHDKNLKAIEEILDSKLIVRVHKSLLVNLNKIKSLDSRKNGDYDAEMANGKIVRLSRHYRSNWAHLLLQSS